MKPMYFTTKGRLMNTIEKFHIYQATKLNNQINDRHTVQPSAIFEILVRLVLDRGHQYLPFLHPPTWPHPNSTLTTS
jgi:hypothetical protein